MEHQTLVAVFDRPGDAREALDALLSSGFSQGEARLGTADELDTGTTASSQSETQHMSWGQRIAHFFGLDDEDTTGTYSEAMRRGSSVVVVDVASDEESERAVSILDRFGPIDMDQRVSEWEASGWQRPEADLATTRTDRDTERNAEQSTIPVIEEQLQVGTRFVQAGGVRIFSRTREIPVEERVELREERATVTRRPTDRPVTDADRPFEERSYEVRETREEPVVAKTARVVEEVVVGKETRRREETVRDKVRKTEVDVQRAADQDPEQSRRQRD